MYILGANLARRQGTLQNNRPITLAVCFRPYYKLVEPDAETYDWEQVQ